MSIRSKSPTVCSVVVASTVAFLILIIEHYLDFGVIGLDMRPPFTYVAGVAALGLAYSLWAGFYRLWTPLAAFWAIVVAGGTAVIGAYTVDWAIDGVDWLPGAAVLLAALVGLLLGLLAFIYWQRKQIKALEASVALERGRKETQAK